MIRDCIWEARCNRWVREYDLALNRVDYLNWYLGFDAHRLTAPVKLRDRHGLVSLEVCGYPLWWSRAYDCYALGEMVRNLDACDDFLFHARGLWASGVDDGIGS